MRTKPNENKAGIFYYVFLSYYLNLIRPYKCVMRAIQVSQYSRNCTSLLFIKL